MNCVPHSIQVYSTENRSEDTEQEMTHSKIHTFDALKEKARDLQKQGKRVVLYYGDFDILHGDLINSITDGASRGDVLFVMLSSDCNRKSDPSRPTFSETKRLQTLCALEVITAVAVNTCDSTFDALQLLLPDVYIVDRECVNGHLKLEQAFAQEKGIEYAVEDIKHLRINTRGEGPIHSRDAELFLKSFSQQHTSDEIISLLESLRGMNVLVIGETIIDEYYFCEALGKTGKEPILAAIPHSFERWCGGACAVANHVANFCDNVHLYSMIGEKNPQEEFIREKLLPNITPEFFVKENSPTVTKTRYLDEFGLQKMFEVYQMNDAPLSLDEEDRCFKRLSNSVSDFDAVIIADYGHGMLSNRLRSKISSQAKFLAVNTQTNAGNFGYNKINNYPSADYVCLTHREYALSAGEKHGNSRELAEQACRSMKCKSVMLTKGKYGNLYYRPGEALSETPAFAVGKVTDRIGAGDAVFSLTSLCVSQNAPGNVIGFLGNVIGAEAVMTICNKEPVHPASLYRRISSLME